MAGLLVRLLAVLDKQGPLAPGDAVAILGEPRYRVLSAFHCLEELGLASLVYAKGTYKIYQITLLGQQILKAAESKGLAAALEEAVFSGTPQHAGTAQISSGT